MTTQVAVLFSLTVVGVVCVVLIVATVSARMRRTARARALALVSAPNRALLLAVASGEDDGSAADALIQLSGPAWEGTRGAVVTLLGKVRGGPADELVEVLRAHGELDTARSRLTHRSPVLRARGAYLLGEAREADAVDLLLPLLHDPAAEVRFVAARSLGRIGQPAAARAVLAAVPGRGGDVGLPAWVAAEAVLLMGPEVEDVVRECLDDENDLVRGVAVSVAAQSTFATLGPALRRRVDTEPVESIRAEAAIALGRVGAAADAAVLAAHTGPEDSAALRRACSAALGELRTRDGAARLHDLLADDDRRLARIAADALLEYGPQGHEALEAAVAQGEAAASAAAAALELYRLREGLEVGR